MSAAAKPCPSCSKYPLPCPVCEPPRVDTKYRDAMLFFAFTDPTVVYDGLLDASIADRDLAEARARIQHLAHIPPARARSTDASATDRA